jgi:hypothetical protein
MHVPFLYQYKKHNDDADLGQVQKPAIYAVKPKKNIKLKLPGKLREMGSLVRGK